ncbi:hypothetical protein IQ249_11360 [Lusitaniella coriacea LEGE 07157]|uniref:DUF3291 domain-containing protein n=1 Tax=Lusitaniella coriacea LEGE 07157 TaxID=945747 RepID=A0A8J7DWS7_9CYAN|nr:hypothetical protein [Lusitaniella coriacea]MBE9116498.1 hypothetical protein [Lusitaniella coriacea LEGE 07157]
MVFISATRLHLRTRLYIPLFLWHTFLIQRQMRKKPGFLGGKLLADANRVYWTLTVWEEAAAMKHLRDAGAHKRAMSYLQKWVDESSVVHWYQDSPEIPSFAEVHQKMLEDGHFSRLKNPSDKHNRRDIPAPVSTRSALALQPYQEGQSRSRKCNIKIDRDRALF